MLGRRITAHRERGHMPSNDFFKFFVPYREIFEDLLQKQDNEIDSIEGLVKKALLVIRDEA